MLDSAVTVWEVSIKRALGKLDAPADLVEAVSEAGFAEVPVTGVDGERAGGLDPHHRDPFDRMLVAQAERLEALTVTRDPAFAHDGVETLPA